MVGFVQVSGHVCVCVGGVGFVQVSGQVCVCVCVCTYEIICDRNLVL